MFEQALRRANEKLASDDLILSSHKKQKCPHLSIIRDSHVNFCSLKCFGPPVFGGILGRRCSKSVLYFMNVGSVKGDALLSVCCC